jgi:Tfp pilus assembly protein PilO
MSNETWIGKKGFRYWYYKFRDSELYSFTTLVVAIFICVVLLIYLILPELNNWFSIRQEVVATRQRIAVLQQNITFMNNLDRNVLNQQLLTSTEALPSQKDFASMLNSISNASANSGVSLNDYSFQVGNIASSSGKSVATNQLTPIQVIVVVNGNIDQIRKFINVIENSLPLAEVTMINGSVPNTAVTIDFYQKPFPTSNFSPGTPLAPIANDKVTLLQKLSEWQNTSGTQSTSPSTSSRSATPLF